MYSDIMGCLGCSFMKASYGLSLAMGISLILSFFEVWFNITDLRPEG